MPLAELGINSAQYASYATGIGQAIVTAIKYGFMLAILGVVLWYILRILQFKHRVRIRYVTGSRTRYIVDDRAKELKEEGRVTAWELQKTKKRIPIPPEEALHIGKKGAFYVECYYTDESGYLPIKEDADEIADAFKTGEEIEGGKKKKQLVKPMMNVKFVLDNNVINKPFDPLTTNQKYFLINQIKKAQMNRPQTLAQMLLQWAPMIALVIIIIFLFAEWNSIAAPAVEASSNYAAAMDKWAEGMGTLQEIKSGVQRIESAIPGSTISTRPPD